MKGRFTARTTAAATDAALDREKGSRTSSRYSSTIADMETFEIVFLMVSGSLGYW